MVPRQLIEGHLRFRAEHFEHDRALFESLARGTHEPLALVIACSDARVPPDVILRARPGDLFALRNIANLVPPFRKETHNRAAGAAIEYAVHALKVAHIVVLGHTGCGGLRALAKMNEQLATEMPTLAGWLAEANELRARLRQLKTTLSPEELEQQLIFENVAVQLENLMTYPVVARALERNALELHGWVYDLADGRIRAYDPQSNAFHPYDRAPGVPGDAPAGPTEPSGGPEAS